MTDSAPEGVASDEGKPTVKAWVLNIYRVFVLCSVVLVYIGSMFMIYCVLADIVFQVTLLFVRITKLFEPPTKGTGSTIINERTVDKIKLVAQICWCLYSFSIVALIFNIIKKQVLSFFKQLWTSLSTENVIKLLGSLFQNPLINKKLAYVSIIAFMSYFVIMVLCIVFEFLFAKQVIYSAVFVGLFFIPVIWGVLLLMWDTWRVAFLSIRGRYSKYTFKPSNPFPNFPFPTDLLDPANLRDQSEFLNFVCDDRTNVYLTDGHYTKKIIGLLHVVALFVGAGCRIYLMSRPELNYSYSGILIIAFYFYCTPFVVFCNICSTFLPAESFQDEKLDVSSSIASSSKRSFDKGPIRFMFYASLALYILIFILLITLSVWILIWERPEEKYRYKFYTKSSLLQAKWTILPSTATTCNIDIKGMTFSQLSALPILSYFTDDDPKYRDINEHNRKVILGMAFSSLKDRKVTEYHDDELSDGLHIRDKKLHIFVIHGLRSPLDWILFFEQFIQDKFSAIINTFIPFFSTVSSFFRVPLIYANQVFTEATGCKFLSVEKAHRIEQQIITNSIPKSRSWPTYTNVAVGHFTGGYFAKYLGSFNQGMNKDATRKLFYLFPQKLSQRPNITAVGFDSLPFHAFQLAINQTFNKRYGMTVNVHSNTFFGHPEELTLNNFQRNGYDTLFPDAVESFCQSVAMCSNTRFEIDFCWTILGEERWTKLLGSYGRYMTKAELVDIDVVTDKEGLDIL